MISLSAASKILLKKEPSISSSGRDILLKPVLFALAGTTTAAGSESNRL